MNPALNMFDKHMTRYSALYEPAFARVMRDLVFPPRKLQEVLQVIPRRL